MAGWLIAASMRPAGATPTLDCTEIPRNRQRRRTIAGREKNDLNHEGHSAGFARNPLRISDCGLRI